MTIQRVEGHAWTPPLSLTNPLEYGIFNCLQSFAFAFVSSCYVTFVMMLTFQYDTFCCFFCNIQPTVIYGHTHLLLPMSIILFLQNCVMVTFRSSVEGASLGGTPSSDATYDHPLAIDYLSSSSERLASMCSTAVANRSQRHQRVQVAFIPTARFIPSNVANFINWLIAASVR